MNLIKTAKGNVLKLTRSDWEGLGRKAGWLKTAMPFETTKWVPITSLSQLEFNYKTDIDDQNSKSWGTLGLTFNPIGGLDPYQNGWTDEDSVKLNNKEIRLIAKALGQAAKGVPGCEVSGTDGIVCDVFFSSQKVIDAKGAEPPPTPLTPLEKKFVKTNMSKFISNLKSMGLKLNRGLEVPLM